MSEERPWVPDGWSVMSTSSDEWDWVLFARGEDAIIDDDDFNRLATSYAKVRIFPGAGRKLRINARGLERQNNE